MAATAVLGAGCVPAPTTPVPSVAEPITEQAAESPILQRRGFGDIPPTPSPPRKPGARGSVRVTAEFPSIPDRASVLRVRSGLPNAPELQNIASALQLPPGSLGRAPQMQELLLTWKDDAGRQWSYRGSDGMLRVTDGAARSTTDANLRFSDEGLKDYALGFFRSIGADMTRLGDPYVDADASTDEIAVIRFNAKQDGQGIWSANGAARVGATVEIHRTDGRIREGSLLVRHDPDRSDYASITREAAQKSLAQGGLGGTPNGDVTIEGITFEWLAMDDAREPPTEYLYPALIGTGTITYSNQRTATYRIVVPLVNE